MDGIINVYKPAGMSSFSCVKKVSKRLGAIKAGHGGTLDPEATGVLPVFLGKATKLADFMHDYDKSYRAGFLLGKTTDSYDIWGNTIEEIDFDTTMNISKEKIEETLRSFIGEIVQIPPAYSAIKISGVPAYKLARAGKEVEIRSRTVNVFSVNLISYNLDNHTGVFDISCSKGTYIRSICNDLGEKLGVGACMCSLERTEYGPFSVLNAVNIDECTEKDILSCDYLLEKYPITELTDEEAKCYASGNYKVINLNSKIVYGSKSEYIRLYNRGKFFALAKADYNEEKHIIDLESFKFFG